MIAIIIIAFYIFSAILTYGINFAYFQREYPTLAEENKRGDMGMAFFCALYGPIGLVAVFLNSGFAKHGLKFR